MNKIKARQQLDEGKINLLPIHRKIMDIVVIELAKICPTLTMINLSYCSKITNKSVLALSECCPKLRTIVLSGCINITDNVKKLLCDKGVKVFPRHRMCHRAERRRRTQHRLREGLGSRACYVRYLRNKHKNKNLNTQNKKRRKTS